MTTNYYEIGDILEYGNITDTEAMDICNSILEKSVDENNQDILEAMFTAIYMGITHHDIASKINIDVILPRLDYFNVIILDDIIAIMAFSGKKEYEEVIKKIGEKYPKLDIEEALYELRTYY